ncbi:MAG: hypothetical protein GF347_01790 [Candidatus Moranbacteria bacterium]|nr:hypothetical protein [Candidatus Moranbacteria bacterium]
MKKNNTPTFGKNGKRRIKCPNPKCDSYIAGKDKNGNKWVKYQYKTDNRSKKLICPKCKIQFKVDPIIEKRLPNGKNKIIWGATKIHPRTSREAYDFDQYKPPCTIEAVPDDN